MFSPSQKQSYPIAEVNPDIENENLDNNDSVLQFDTIDALDEKVQDLDIKSPLVCKQRDLYEIDEENF